MTQQERNTEIENRINAEIDKCKMAYKIQDCEGNVFVFKGIEGGFPSFRTLGGQKVISDLNGFTIVEKYISIN